MVLPDRIPVFLLSGFLGAGKSTLLNEFLGDPSVKDTAVIINEFGDVPVDHLLVRQGQTTISQISTGCLCCSDSTDIRQTLADLEDAVSEGLTGKFARVIVEMSGLGDPAPLVNAFAANTGTEPGNRDDTNSPEFYLAGVVTLFDTIAGTATVENHFEALKQLAFADQIVLTKTDMTTNTNVATDSVSLTQGLRELNASAEIIDRQTVDLMSLFSPRPYSEIDRGEDVAGWLALETVLAQDAGHAHRASGHSSSSRHGDGIRTFSIVSDTPLSEKRFHRFLSLLQNSAGQRLLRVKGIVATEESPEAPLIVHAVQHTVSKPNRLPAWPDEDHRTRLVFIMDGIDPEPVRDLFTAILEKAPFSLVNSLKNAGGVLRTSISRKFSNFTDTSRRSQ